MFDIENLIGAAFWGFLFGAVFTIALTLFVPTSPYHLAEKALLKCEAELPRNQRCVITAIPKEESDATD